MNWLYISPHLDDVALSCGGLVWEQTQAGDRVQIWSIFAGDPPEGVISTFAGSLHTRWDLAHEATELRRQEDISSCEIIGAGYLHFNYPDCIYRLGPPGAVSEGQPLYTSEESLWGAIHPDEVYLVRQLSSQLESAIEHEGAYLVVKPQVVCPLALGEHVDHKLVRRAVEGLMLRLWYYEDYPYSLQEKDLLNELHQDGWEEWVFTISPAGLDAWIRAVGAHASQVSTFWHHDTERRIPANEMMNAAIRDYTGQRGGVRMWRPPKASAG